MSLFRAHIIVLSCSSTFHLVLLLAASQLSFYVFTLTFTSVEVEMEMVPLSKVEYCLVRIFKTMVMIGAVDIDAVFTGGVCARSQWEKYVLWVLRGTK